MGPAVHPSRAEQVVGVTPTDGIGTRHARQQGERLYGSQIKKELKRITGLFRPGLGNASVPYEMLQPLFRMIWQKIRVTKVSGTGRGDDLEVN